MCEYIGKGTVAMCDYYFKNNSYNQECWNEYIHSFFIKKLITKEKLIYHLGKTFNMHFYNDLNYCILAIKKEILDNYPELNGIVEKYFLLK